MATQYEKGRASVENFAHRANDRLGDAAKDAGETVRDYASMAQDKAERAVHEYPLATVAGAAALGLLVGMVLRR